MAVVLAIAFRGIGTALGVGLVWILALENTVNGLSFLLEVGPVQKVLLGPSAGSLAAALGATTQDNGGTPGVVVTASPPGRLSRSRRLHRGFRRTLDSRHHPARPDLTVGPPPRLGTSSLVSLRDSRIRVPEPACTEWRGGG
ncbi:MAG: hypothetical protein M3548_14620, partial [Actinomycetota bacterium]|nr:hypothetical protein [Actinomycetota bacterium]